MEDSKNVNNLYAPFRRTFVMESIETRIDELSNEQIDQLHEVIKDADDKPFTIPEAEK